MSQVTTPLVSICCLAFNHEKYIRDALDGFMMQKTDFVFEVLIHDDASTDSTADIIREYEAKYPDVIKPIYQTENQYSKGIRPTFKYNFPRAKGKYIALCEGDDYWIDSCKLQQQVNFLEENNQISVCFHQYIVLDQEGNKLHTTPRPPLEFNKSLEFSIKHFGTHWYYQTLTSVFRKSAIEGVDFEKYSYSRDTHLFFHILLTGNGYLMNTTWGVYRNHDNGIFSKREYLDIKKCAVLSYKELKEVNKEYCPYIRTAYKLNICQYENAIIDSIIDNKFCLNKGDLIEHLMTYYKLRKCFIIFLGKLALATINRFLRLIFKL